jgi:hypothetical protein
MATKKTSIIKKNLLKRGKDEDCCSTAPGSKGTCGGAYGLGLIGAAVYFIQHATTFWGGVIGLLKAMVWPAIVVYQLLAFLKS